MAPQQSQATHEPRESVGPYQGQGYQSGDPDGLKDAPCPSGFTRRHKGGASREDGPDARAARLPNDIP